MRTTIRIDDRLLEQVRAIAMRSGKTMAEVIEDAIRETLARRRTKPKRKRVKLPTFKGKGLRPGVDLDDSAAVLDLMERS